VPPTARFDRHPLFHTEVLRGESVAHAAAEAKKPVLLILPKHTPAIGTGERRGLARALFTGNHIHIKLGNAQSLAAPGAGLLPGFP
jgi:hypothetical protein